MATPITAKRGKIFEIQMIQSPDVKQFFKNLKSRYMLKSIEMSISKSLNMCQNQAQKNITSMKAVLSGFMRNKWDKAMSRINPNEITGYLWNRSWYAFMVHEGLGPHAIPPNPKWIDPNRNLTPSNIIELQKKRLAARKWKSKKGPRPFLRKAVDDKLSDIRKTVVEGINTGIYRSFSKSQKRVFRSRG